MEHFNNVVLLVLERSENAVNGEDDDQSDLDEEETLAHFRKEGLQSPQHQTIQEIEPSKEGVVGLKGVLEALKHRIQSVAFDDEFLRNASVQLRDQRVKYQQYREG